MKNSKMNNGNPEEAKRWLYFTWDVLNMESARVSVQDKFNYVVDYDYQGTKSGIDINVLSDKIVIKRHEKEKYAERCNLDSESGIVYRTGAVVTLLSKALEIKLQKIRAEQSFNHKRLLFRQWLSKKTLGENVQ